ncbi:MAG TPA: TonB-dependent receptor [Caulobacteraceae bacterium]|nr:TonB-dependent receptor [Caulobacteraceae bacterium]
MAYRSGREAGRLRTPQYLAALLVTASALALASAAHADDPAGSDQKSVGEVVITAPREEVKARAVQQAAPNIVRVQAAETILKYPDFNAAEALGRMPDISLSSDTGEGRFVQIRGIDANLNGATYGGVPLLNTNPGGTAAGGGGRAVEFDTIPQGAIDGIIVTLTGQPDHEAEGLGGTIELSPRSAAHIDHPFVDFTLGAGYEPLHAHGGPFNADIAVGGRFGFGDKGFFLGNGDDQAPRAGFISNPAPFSFVFSASWRDDRRGIDDLEESYLDDGVAPENGVHQYDLRYYNYHRRRFGYGGEFDFEPNDDHTWYVRADVAGYVEAQKKNFLLFTHMPDPTVNPAFPAQFITTTTPEITLTDEQETHRNQVYVVGGKDRFGDWIIDYHLAYSQATFHVDRNIGATFSGPANTPIAYNNVTTPNFPIFGFPGGFNVNDASAYTLSRINNNTNLDDDHEWSAAGNAQVPLHLWGGDDAVRFGFQVRLRDKVASEFDDTITAPPLSLAGLSFAPVTYYDGHYSNGPFINLRAIEALIKNGGAPIDSFLFNQGSFFRDKENIYAGYAMYTGQWGKFGLMGGVRVEATDAVNGAFRSSTVCTDSPPPPPGASCQNSVTNTTFVNQPQSYINAFPTVQLRYNFTPQMQLRFTYSTGIARPGFNQNTAAASVDFTQSPVVISRGNPNLKPTLGQNFDLSFEYYMADGGILQIGAFDKEFTNYIAPRIQLGVTNDPLAPGQLANVTTFLNIPSAYARGVDADYHERFVWLAKPFDGLGVDANVTFVDSHIVEYTAAQSLTGLQQNGLLPGTSPITWNIAGFYEAYGFDLRLAAQYVEHSLFGLGGDKSRDVIQDNRTTLDFTSAYHVNQHWTVYFNAKNLLNTPLRYYEGFPFRPIQREFYDVTYEAGVRAHF